MSKMLPVICMGLIYTTTAMAEFSVEDKSWPKQLPASEYGPHNYYGNSKNTSFYRATDNPGDMSATEQNTVNGMLPESEFNRWYAKLGIYNNTLKLSSIKNNSPSTSAFNGLILTSDKVSKDRNSLLFGGGYTWCTWRMDVEVLLSQKLDYNQNPLFTTGANSLESKLNSNNVIATFYYDFKEFFVFRPFIGLSAGLGVNKTTTKLNGSSEKSNNRIAPALGLQLGARTRVLNTNAFVSAGYRYLYLGSAKFVDPADTINLSGNVISSGFSLDLSYML